MNNVRERIRMSNFRPLSSHKLKIPSNIHTLIHYVAFIC